MTSHLELGDQKKLVRRRLDLNLVLQDECIHLGRGKERGQGWGGGRAVDALRTGGATGDVVSVEGSQIEDQKDF